MEEQRQKTVLCTRGLKVWGMKGGEKGRMRQDRGSRTLGINAVFRVRNTMMGFRIPLFSTLISIRIALITLMQIRILIQICNHWSTDPPRLHFELISLHYKRPRPYIAPFWASTTPEFLIWWRTRISLLTLIRIRIRIRFPKLFGSMGIRIRNTEWL